MHKRFKTLMLRPFRFRSHHLATSATFYTPLDQNGGARTIALRGLLKHGRSLRSGQADGATTIEGYALVNTAETWSGIPGLCFSDQVGPTSPRQCAILKRL